MSAEEVYRAMQFQIGDVVRMKSGGPVMTIKSARKDPPGEWYCVWFAGPTGEDAKEVRGDYFRPETLEKLK